MAKIFKIVEGNLEVSEPKIYTREDIVEFTKRIEEKEARKNEREEYYRQEIKRNETACQAEINDIQSEIDDLQEIVRNAQEKGVIGENVDVVNE